MLSGSYLLSGPPYALIRIMGLGGKPPANISLHRGYRRKKAG
jgi:hypothetical protein